MADTHTIEQLQKGFYDYLAHTKRVCDRTIYSYFVYFNLFPHAEITQKTINRFCNRYNNRSEVRAFLKNYLEFRKLHKEFDLPPAPTGRKPQRIIRPISKRELEAVSEFLYKKGFRYGLVFDLIYQGALRRFELPNIRISDFQWENWLANQKKMMKLRIRGKNAKDRIVLVNPSTVLKIVEHYFEKAKHDEVVLQNILSSDDLMFNLNEIKVWRIVRDGSLKALGRNIRTHELRHARAEELAQAGVPLKDIQNYLGHSSIAITEIYLRKNTEQSLTNIENIMNH